jgi:hypothetical protein
MQGNTERHRIGETEYKTVIDFLKYTVVSGKTPR